MSRKGMAIWSLPHLEKTLLLQFLRVLGTASETLYVQWWGSLMSIDCWLWQTGLAIGAFATTLTTLSLSLMQVRGVTTTNVYIGNFFFVAGIGMLISAQWEIVKGNSFAYTVLSAFGQLAVMQREFSVALTLLRTVLCWIRSYHHARLWCWGCL